MSAVKKAVVDSDIIAEHVVCRSSVSVLRVLLRDYFCYTTVFNAVELFASARSLKEKETVQRAMDALKVLGVGGKSAKNIGAVVSSSQKDYTALIAGTCLESGLPIITARPQMYQGIRGLVVIPVKGIQL